MSEEHFYSKLPFIKAFVFDVDGVFTNNELVATEAGDLLRTFNAKDGFALKHAIQQGYEVCIITGGTSAAVHKRFDTVGVKHNYYKVADKVKVLREFLAQTEIAAENVLYIADDIPDHASMQMCGLKCCPSDAVPEIQSVADYICLRKGGDGCVREVIEMVLKVQGKWFEELK
ncbi:MAG: 3-deoxy-D-manno-octulosonate 8-phosphate phosphatase [Sphingobacteriales bacterium]|nr:3-deoxy-D-manno-octulosonate 8-phosphate phosphatase [Sphingobacteriales bacterium]